MQCRNEAMSFFGNDHLLMEKYIPSARHIEFQIFTDGHGNGVHLNERDCSVQRGNQKVFEESPAVWSLHNLCFILLFFVRFHSMII